MSPRYTDGPQVSSVHELPYGGVESAHARTPSSVLLVIVTIAATILATFLFLAVISSKRGPHARYIRCVSILRSFGNAAQVYSFDRDRESFPPDLDTLVTLGFVVEDRDQCPTYRSLRAPGTGYHYVTDLSREDPGYWILAFDDPDDSQHDKINVLLVNGNVESLSDSDFKDRLTRFYRDYGKARGHPPAVIPPAAPATAPP